MFKVLSKILYTILLIIETVIAIRVVFKFINAEAANQLVGFVYSLSENFVKPFGGIITNNIKLGKFTIDTTAILALIVYMVIAFILVEMIKVFSTYTEPRRGE